jgi:hypothetical protein
MSHMAAMKTLLCSITVGLATFGLLWADDPKKDDKQTVKSLMTAKLEYSKKILAAVAQNDFSQVEKNALELTRISNELGSREIRAERYQDIAKEFRNELQGLMKAARAKNSEAMGLAYVKTTLACFNCHNYMREIKVANR